jgi:hypothetical protein
LKKSGSKATGAEPKQPVKLPLDLETIEPNLLRDRLLKVLSRLAPEEQSAVRDHLLVGLEQAGVNIGGVLFLLGVLARTSRELTPADLASLIRFVRINSPQAMRFIAAPLAELLAASDETGRTMRPSWLAA